MAVDATPAQLDTGPREYRVHGIGNHGLLSALGTPPPLNSVDPDDERVVPVEWHYSPRTDHVVVLANWSRFSRKLARFLWFFAIPFTLVNTAAYMGPAGDSRRARARRGLVSMTTQIASLLTTVLAAMWLIACIETVLRYVRLPGETGYAWTWAAPAVTGVALIGGILVRFARPQRASLGVSLIHIAVLGGLLGWLCFARPAAQAVPNAVPPFLRLQPRGLVEERLDVLAAVTVGSLVMLVVVTALAAFADLLLRLGTAGEKASVSMALVTV